MKKLAEPGADRRAWVLPLILVVLALGRLGFAALVYARPDLAIANDTDRYVPIANAILSGQALRPNPARPGLLLNTIGYPLFLAAVYTVRGSAAGDVALAQLILSSALGIVTYLLLRPRLGAWAASVAGLILLFDPLTLLWSMTVLTETLLAFVLGLAALTITSWAFSPKNTTLILAGTLCGLGCLVKPYALVVVAIWGLALMLPHPNGPEQSRAAISQRFKHMLLFALPIMVLLVPWIVRNAMIWDCPALSSVDRVTMRDYVAAKVLADAQHAPLDQIQAQLQASDPGVCPRKGAQYVNIVLSHPAVYAKLHIAGTIPVLIGTNFDRWLQYFGIKYTLPDLWGPFVDGGPAKFWAVIAAEGQRFPQGVGLMLAMTAFQVAIYVLVIMGIMACWKSKSASTRWNIAILALAALALAVTPGQGGNERFRVPLQPLLAILSAYALAWRARPSIVHGEHNTPTGASWK